MVSENLEQSLNVIREYIVNLSKLQEDEEVKIMKTQLRLLEKSINQFERDGVHVPEGMKADKLSLESRIKELEKGPQELLFLYDKLIDIILQLGYLLMKRPDNDLRRKIRESKKHGLSNEILRKNIILILSEMGGTAHQSEIIKEMRDKLKEIFTPADLVKPFGRRLQWEINVLKERDRMIKEGLLTPDSKSRKWSLSSPWNT